MLEFWSRRFQPKARVIAPTTDAVTMTPAMQTPAAMAGKACLNLRPKMKAMAEPVQAPVTGRGTATNNVRARRPYLR